MINQKRYSKYKKRKMTYKIAVDARPLSSAVTGISRSISKILENIDYPFEFFLLSHLPIHNDFKYLLEKKNVFWKTLQITFFSIKGWSWYLVDLPYYLNYTLKPDIYWGTQQTLPFFLKRSIKTIVTIHDFVAFFYPKSMKKLALYQQKFFLKRSLKKVDLIICVSKATETDLKNLFPFVKKVNTIYWGFDRPKTIQNIKNSLLEKKFILAVSTIEPRKNYSTLLEAYYNYFLSDTKEPYLLIIIGRKGWESKQFYKRLEELKGRTQTIFVLENISDEILYNFYKHCAFFCLSSFYEGFGLPVVEALSFCKRVILSDIPVFREIAGKYATFIPSNDIQKWSATIKYFVELHRKKTLKPTRCTALQSWRQTANLYGEAFKSLISS